MVRSRRIKERRVSQRVPIAVPVFARGFDEQGKEFLEFTATLNISAGGALVAMRRYLAPSSSITLEIPSAPMPKLSEPSQISRIFQARVVRVSPSNSSFLCALSFDEPLN